MPDHLGGSFKGRGWVGSGAQGRGPSGGGLMLNAIIRTARIRVNNGSAASSRAVAAPVCVP
jgi:hypothetical protein